MKYRHSDKFFDEKWEDFKQFCRDKGIINPYQNKSQYINEWEGWQESGVKNIDRIIKYDAQFETRYKTALTEYQRLKELDPDSVLKFKDIKKMTTSEFAEMYNNQINAMYHNLRGSGMSSEDAQAYNSAYWFGSE